MLQGQRDLLTVARQMLDRAGAAGERAPRRVLHGRDATTTRSVLKLFASLRLPGAQDASRTVFALGQGLVGQAALEKQAHRRSPTCRRDYIRISSALGEAPPHEHRRRARSCSRARSRASSSSRRSSASAGIQLAFLDQMLESLGIVVATIEATMRTDELLRQSQSMAEELRTPAGGAAADQRGARGEGAPAHRAEGRGREEEPRGRARQAGARGEGGAARAHLEVQVAVPREHVARAAHAAQLAAHPVAPARRQRRGQPQRQADPLRRDDPPGGRRPDDPDQRDPRSREDRVRHDGRRASAQVRFDEPARLRRPDVPPGRRGEGPAVRASSSTTACPSTIDTDDMRLRQVLRNLLSNAIKFTEQGPRQAARGAGASTAAACRRASTTPTSDRVRRSPIPASASRRTSSG